MSGTPKKGEKGKGDKIFAVRRVSLRKTKAGKNYLDLLLANSEGEIVGRKWDVESRDSLPEVGTVIVTEGKEDTYNDTPQWIMTKWKVADNKEREEAELVPSVGGDHEARWERLIEAAKGIKAEGLRGLTVALFEQNKESIMGATAAKMMHSAGRGGLMEHVDSLLTMAKGLGPQLEGVDSDLLVAGILLHDIGKIREMMCEPALDYTTEGRMLGHIVIGSMMIDEAAKKRGMPQEEVLPLLHLVVSHHGTKEFGSPVAPMTPEAVALHHLDSIDAKLNAMSGSKEKGLFWHNNLRQFVFLSQEVSNSQGESPVDSGSESNRTASKEEEAPSTPRTPTHQGEKEPKDTPLPKEESGGLF